MKTSPFVISLRHHASYYLKFVQFNVYLKKKKNYFFTGLRSSLVKVSPIAIKCPLLNNENVTQPIAQTCRLLLWQELRLLCPRIICPLGPMATQLLLGDTNPFDEIRGKINLLEIGNYPIKVIPTYSPDHLLHNPKDKDTAWLDVQLIRKEYDQAVS